MKVALIGYGKAGQVLFEELNVNENTQKMLSTVIKKENGEEKVINNELVCEHCGLDMFKHYKNANLKAIITAMDVDHINPLIKDTPEGEQPNNYQLLCKMCHIIKSYDEGDYTPKKYKRDLES